MWVDAGKSALKKNIQVGVSQRLTMRQAAIVVDVSAVIWTLEWPASGTVATLISGFKIQLSLQLSEANLCFNRYRITTTPPKAALDLPEQQIAMSTISH